MAARFWVLGTGTWDASDTTHWAASSGGAGGQSVPGSSDAVTLDGASGGGTVTVNTTVTIQSLTCGAFTGTLDFSANNNNVTLSLSGGFSNSNTGTRTVNLGGGTWTLSATNALWNSGTTTGLTFNANSSTIAFTSGASTNQRNFIGGGLTYNIVTFSGNTSLGQVLMSGANTFATLTITAPQYFTFPAGVTTTITNAFNYAGSSTSLLNLNSSSAQTAATISVAAGSPTITWASLRALAFTGGATFTATSSLDTGINSGITITAPSSAGGISRARAASGF